MTRRTHLLIVLALPVLATVLWPAAARGQNAAAVAWLAGCWAAPDAETGSGEMWTAPAGGTVFGVSRTVKGGRTVAWEFMQIRDEADGTYFVAKPSGQAETRFKALTLTGTRAVFENPAHDFPQRVIYERRDGGTLLGRIEGTRGGKAAVVDFPLQPAACR